MCYTFVEFQPVGVGEIIGDGCTIVELQLVGVEEVIGHALYYCGIAIG